jgi:hypothetical protein
VKDDHHKLKGRFDMSTSRLALIAAMMLSMGLVIFPQGSVHAQDQGSTHPQGGVVRYCAKIKGEEHPDCSFRHLGTCRAHVREMGGGHCYALHH